MSADWERVLRRSKERRRSTWLLPSATMRWCGCCGRRERRSAGAVGGWMLRAWGVSFDGAACVGMLMVLSVVFTLCEWHLDRTTGFTVPSGAAAFAV